MYSDINVKHFKCLLAGVHLGGGGGEHFPP